MARRINLPMNQSIAQLGGAEVIGAITRGAEILVENPSMSFDELLRAPWERQKHHIEAAVKGLSMMPKITDGYKEAKGNRHPTFLMNWDMGCGKTTGGAAVAHKLAQLILQDNYNKKRSTQKRFDVAVLLPPTLYKKWQTEFVQVLPAGSYRVVDCNGNDAAQKVLADREDPTVTGLTFYIFPDTKVREHYHTGRQALRVNFTGKNRDIDLQKKLDELATKTAPKNAKVLKEEDFSQTSSGNSKKKKGVIGLLADGNKNKKEDLGFFARCPECGGLPFWEKVGADGHWRYKTVKDVERSRVKECPLCNKSWLTNISANTVGAEDMEDDFSDEKPHKMARCMSPAYIFKKERGHGKHRLFDLCIIDELHRSKGTGVQGKTTRWMANASRRVLGLTGTLTGGRARDLHYLLYMLCPWICRTEGVPYDSPDKFLDKYGAKVVTTATNPKSGKDERSSKAIPGISSEVYGKFLAKITTFMSVEEIVADGDITMPERIEEVVLVPMANAEMRESYNKMISKLKTEIQKVPRGDKTLNGLVASALTLWNSWPDSLGFNTFEYAAGDLKIALDIDKLDIDVTDKEQAVLDILQQEASEGRRTLIYSNYRDCGPRLLKVLEAQGVNVVHLTEKVPAAKREQWLEDVVNLGVDVVIVNPELVKEGLDLLSFQTIIFYQATLNLFTHRQSMRRVYRPGQRSEVRHFFVAYEDTYQETTMRLVADKYNSALLAEGNMEESAVLDLANQDSQDSILRMLIKSVLDSDESLQLVKKPVSKPAVPVSTVSIVVSAETGFQPVRVTTTTRVVDVRIRKAKPAPEVNIYQLSLFEFVDAYEQDQPQLKLVV